MSSQDPNAPVPGGQPYQGQPYQGQPYQGQQPYGQGQPYGQQPSGAYPQQPYPPTQPAPAKKRSIPPWLVLGVIAIGIGSRFLDNAHAPAMTCDSSDVATTVLDIINKQYAARHASFKATGLSQTTKLGAENGMTRCSGTVSFSDGDTLRLFYNLTGTHVDVQATQPGAGASGNPGGAANSKSS